MPTIALFLPNWIGDVVMATPAIRAVHHSYPSHRLIAIGRSYVRDVVSGLPYLRRFIPLDRRGFIDSWQSLKAERPSSAILFPNSFRVAAMAKAAGCRSIVGMGRYGRDFLLTKRLYAPRDRNGTYRPVPVIHEYNRIATAFGTSDPGYRMELAVTPRDETQTDVFWSRKGLNRYRTVIGINPGGAFGSSKHWPTASFAEVARQLTTFANTAVLILCGPQEREEARRIAGQANHPSVLSLADESLSIGLTKSVIRRLAMLVTTDSGPRHMATALGVPAVTLFGPTHIGWTETYSPLDRNVQLSLPCGPCQQRVCPLGHHRCMTELTPDSVLNVIHPLFARVARHAA